MGGDNVEFPASEERRQQLLQLTHDVNNHLGVVSTGMEALSVVREDPDQFAEMFEAIQKDGIEPLKRLVAELVKVACEERR